MPKTPDPAGPCGIYCGACPSYNRSCRGCGSEDVDQKRKSKWACKIRTCCFGKKNLEFCFQCGEFPCGEYRRKLVDSHPGDARFRYRHEVMGSLDRIRTIGVERWLVEQEEKWRCPQCGGVVRFYVYRCPDCGHDQTRSDNVPEEGGN
jgi:hypothetical protein